MSSRPEAADLKMDPASLYREEVFTDRRMGTIRVLTPVKTDGSFDIARKVLYVGEAEKSGEKSAPAAASSSTTSSSSAGGAGST